MSEKPITTTPENTVLKVENLRYLNKGLKHHLSFEIHTGEIIAILGASGTGKTTLLNTLAGLSPADGMLTLAGYYLNDLAPKKATQLRSEYFSFLKANPPAPQGKKVKRAITEITTALSQKPVDYLEEIIDGLGLSPHLDKSMDELSDSAKQTVALAAALGKKSQILFADNPTRRMTPEDTALALQTLLKVVSEHKLTAIYSTSDPAIAALADRVLVIRNGEIIVELAGPNEPENIANFTSYLAELAYPPVLVANPASARLEEELDEAPAVTGQFPIILPLPNRPVESDLDADETETSLNTQTEPAEVNDSENIDLTVLDQLTKAAGEGSAKPEAERPLPGETLEETLQRLAPTRNFDPDSAHLLDEAQRILKSLPGSVIPDPTWPTNRGTEDV
ncbi:ATP-binding cassette domain-containing protein [Gleimia sp. 6138-11-ORH1]|uniref:ATP-binding cassette domain-containing protein n=1 Tax=Gleimia sp. 6138-11-ORH1 TaxID=2973937 RepID=UPI002169A08E|nr:ATP-binding cassette domain-containing protein [Gleimia sp. 6138-11-ORH1]MCS4484695.1 ATP-binding cassette domain-containing protein [Gleimia sp. 6138-11-ORH1]